MPIKNRYTLSTIKEAGFSDEYDVEPGPVSRNIMGKPDQLIHEYLFSSRDGAERSRDTQSAQVLGQLLSNIMQIEKSPRH